MTANERRADIMRILICRRHETMGKLAREFGVSDRTIRNDILLLTVDYPLDTVRGNGGCVKLADWYSPNKIILSKSQENVLYQLIDKADGSQQKVLREILSTYGSPLIRKQIAENTMEAPHDGAWR